MNNTTYTTSINAETLKLKPLRQKAGHTLTQLATETGISENALNCLL